MKLKIMRSVKHIEILSSPKGCIDLYICIKRKVYFDPCSVFSGYYYPTMHFISGSSGLFVSASVSVLLSFLLLNYLCLCAKVTAALFSQAFSFFARCNFLFPGLYFFEFFPFDQTT